AHGPKVRPGRHANDAAAIVQRPDDPSDVRSMAIAVQVGRVPAGDLAGAVDPSGDVQVRVGGVDAAVEDRHVHVHALVGAVDPGCVVDARDAAGYRLADGGRAHVQSGEFEALFRAARVGDALDA